MAPPGSETQSRMHLDDSELLIIRNASLPCLDDHAQDCAPDDPADRDVEMQNRVRSRKKGQKCSRKKRSCSGVCYTVLKTRRSRYSQKFAAKKRPQMIKIVLSKAMYLKQRPFWMFVHK